ncbi:MULTISPECIES: winged helix-turn-helix domain-containing protein [unclassified Enterococcus]|uniref:winged helix-turn-helix domain-containing protein n=1 Tax=unclassified Enterococcus TaxID=2608891 RepID=UPI001CE213D2|nr:MULTISPECIES: winged helix-turn-helix domain-containing protein [unclassified Enterococcus]MCA5014234.1 response regulator transcription factor [Enterococcus sp. S23]MCA5017546.1 response regulator transcription factor [Enterococcus sp. S22(2020)]
MTRIGLLSTSSYDTDLRTLLIQNGYEATKVQGSDHVEGIDIILIDKNKENDVSKTIEYLLNLKEQQLPIWVIAKDYVTDEKLIYLQLGANGVISKTTEMKELLLTIHNYLCTGCTLSDSLPKDALDSLILDHNKQCIVVDKEQEITFTRKEFRAFEILYQNMNDTVTYEELFQYLWNGSKDKKIYRVANIIFHIRNKLPENKKYMIQTIRSKGYILKP